MEARIAPKPVHLSFVVGKVALGHDSLSLNTLGFPSHIPPAIFVGVHLNTAPAEGLENEAWEPSNKATVFFIFEFPCIVTLYYIKNQLDATLAVLFISHCKITLHVSDAFCVHHQEY